mmetsp:Transcript_18144/g.31008  ORF Transcript_18144/g.31008 Transcript_18144/m.31008 type:complete len:96 (+) Transcript_18144:697-984(+)
MTKILYHHSDRNLGARQIDYALLETFAAEFKAKNGVDPMSNQRCRLRMLDQVEKLRKLLTANKESELNCESLMEDIDFRRKVTREELEMLAAKVQ